MHDHDENNSNTAPSWHFGAGARSTGRKFCPGWRCRVFLPLTHFDIDADTSDMLAAFCATCITRDRHNPTTRPAFLGARLHKPASILSESRGRSRGPPRLWHREREGPAKGPCQCALDYIGRVLDHEAAARRIETPLSAEVVFSRLFDSGVVHCLETGAAMTPECFLEHHTLSVRVTGNHFEAVCDKAFDRAEDGDRAATG